MGNTGYFSTGNQLRVPLGMRYDADGTVWLQTQSHGALTAKTPYKVILNEYGYITADLADDVKYYYHGVPPIDVASGDISWIQIGGYCANVITPSLSVAVGNAISNTNGTLTDDAADFSGAAGQFMISTESSSSSTTQDVILVPERIICGHA